MKLFILGLLTVVLVLSSFNSSVDAAISCEFAGQCPFPNLATCTNQECTYAQGNCGDASYCNQPPSSPTCADAGTRRTYPSQGTCPTGTCVYTPTDTPCNTPPAQSCTADDKVQTYSSSGTCSSGACSYQPNEATSCPSGQACQNGACVAQQVNTCAGVTCSPTVKTCPDGEQVSCGNTCSNGACSQCTPSCTGHDAPTQVESCIKTNTETVYSIKGESLVLKDGCKLSFLDNDVFVSLPQIGTHTCESQTSLKTSSEFCTEGKPYCDPNTNTCVQASELSSYQLDTDLFYPKAAKTGSVFYTQTEPGFQQETNLLSLDCVEQEGKFKFVIGEELVDVPTGISCSEGQAFIEQKCKSLSNGASLFAVGSGKYEDMLDYVEGDEKITFTCVGGDELSVSKTKLADLGGETVQKPFDIFGIFRPLFDFFTGFGNFFGLFSVAPATDQNTCSEDKSEEVPFDVIATVQTGLNTIPEDVSTILIAFNPQQECQKSWGAGNDASKAIDECQSKINCNPETCFEADTEKYNREATETNSKNGQYVQTENGVVYKYTCKFSLPCYCSSEETNTDTDPDT